MQGVARSLPTPKLARIALNRRVRHMQRGVLHHSAQSAPWQVDRASRRGQRRQNEQLMRNHHPAHVKILR